MDKGEVAVRLIVMYDEPITQLIYELLFTILTFSLSEENLSAYV